MRRKRCPDLGAELKRGIARFDEVLGDRPSCPRSRRPRKESAICCRIGERRPHIYYRADSRRSKGPAAGNGANRRIPRTKRQPHAQQLDSLTARLETIAPLQDVTRIRASIDESARQLRSSVARMTAESKAVIDHLRVEVSTYQAKLEKAEYVASCDALTGLGSRLWVEGRIHERIELGNALLHSHDRRSWLPSASITNSATW